jgi:Ca2+-binding RTX toxin-like protein
MTSGAAIWVMNADGSQRRQVSVTRGVAPAWSPDGTQLAFAGLREFPEFGSRYGPAIRYDAYAVGADGKDERRLTGPLGDEFSYLPGGSAPSWWPDGSRLFFQSSRTAADGGVTTYVMNADGTCEGRFAPLVRAPLFDAAWRPGMMAGAGRLSCIDLRVDVSASSGYVGLKQSVVYHITIENDGSLSATGLRVELIVPSPVIATASPALGTCGGGARVVCELGPLAPGRETALEVFARSPAAGTIRIPISVTADQNESDPSSNTKIAETIVLPCTIVGTDGNDAIYGTGGRDVICARPGWDRINALGGNDTIRAGSGNDTVDAGKGRDSVSGEGGADVIIAQDGERDVIDCGTEGDVVVADRVDRVARDCERVFRA